MSDGQECQTVIYCTSPWRNSRTVTYAIGSFDGFMAATNLIQFARATRMTVTPIPLGGNIFGQHHSELAEHFWWGFCEVIWLVMIAGRDDTKVELWILKLNFVETVNNNAKQFENFNIIHGFSKKKTFHDVNGNNSTETNQTLFFFNEFMRNVWQSI